MMGQHWWVREENESTNISECELEKNSRMTTDSGRTDYNPMLVISFGLRTLVAQTVKNSPTMQETWVRPLGWEDSLEEGMATHSSILSWRIPWTEEPGRLQSMGSPRVGHN